jgi:hypothetical protein
MQNSFSLGTHALRNDERVATGNNATTAEATADSVGRQAFGRRADDIGRQAGAPAGENRTEMQAISIDGKPAIAAGEN